MVFVIAEARNSEQKNDQETTEARHGEEKNCCWARENEDYFSVGAKRKRK